MFRTHLHPYPRANPNGALQPCTGRSTEPWIDRICELFLIFLTGALVGWVYEEIFYWITEGLLRNRGVLYGPWLPVYGIGALVLYALKPFRKKPVLLFLLGVGVTGAVEGFVGLLSIHCFGLRLWDYRGEFGNIGGIVCVRSVMTFAAGGLLLHAQILPAIKQVTNRLGRKFVRNGCAVLAAVLLVDSIFSILFRMPITY